MSCTIVILKTLINGVPSVLEDGELLQEGDLQRARAAGRPGLGGEGQEEIRAGLASCVVFLRCQA